MPSEDESKGKNPTVSTTRRTSSTSADEAMSTASLHSTDTHSILDRHPHSLPANEILTPYLSHTSTAAATGAVVPTPARTWRRESTGSRGSAASAHAPAFEVDFAAADRANPLNWPLWYRGCVLVMISYATMCMGLYSSVYASSIPGMVRDWGVGAPAATLGLTTYLLGVAAGSLVLAPLSEMYGRRPIYLVAMSVFVVFIVPNALARNLATVLVVRFVGAFFAAAAISNSPGTVNDIVPDEHRALAFSIWSVGPLNGPVLGPIIGGFVYQYLGWRWTSWMVLILGGVAVLFVFIIPETYPPAILRKRVEKKIRETGDTRWWSRYGNKEKFWPLLKVNLSRPLLLTIREPICIFWDVYIAFVYGILYLCFVAYPIVFTEIRGWSYGLSGLAFLGIGFGSMVVIIAEPLIRKMINSHKKDPETGRPFPEAMVSIVCISAILIPAGELWFAWTCTPNVFWVWPVLAGIPFGMGNTGVFIYATNYLVQSYGIYAASALAGNTVLRSIMGATLPLAGDSLYRNLGPNWAGTTLGLLEAAFIPIPFIFYRYGYKIRQKSALIRQMQEDRRQLEATQRKIAERGNEQAQEDFKSGATLTTTAAVGDATESEKGDFSTSPP